MKRTLWGLFFVATMLSSCKKEEPNSPSFTQSSQKEMKSTDAYISFDMEVDQPKALNFDINADGLPLLIREDKIKVYCSIVESGTTSPNFQRNLSWRWICRTKAGAGNNKYLQG